MRPKVLFLGLLLVATPSVVSAQSTVAEHPTGFSRWIEFQTLTLYSRYRFIENSAGKTTSNQLQYKEAIRARFNVDRRKRVTLNAGLFSGSSFISTWNNWGIGTGDFDRKNNYLKQLFVAVNPARGIDMQAGGIYVRRGEDDDITTYDDDGYVVGERVTISRPKQVFLDDITFTRGALGPFNEPNLWNRWQDWSHPNYAQALIIKRFTKHLAGSLDYSTQSGARTIRMAVTLRLSKGRPIQTVKYEQYRRVNQRAAAGFALWAERTLGPVGRLQAGYVTVDQFYGGWNADRLQSGRRLFAILNVPIAHGLSAQLFGTEALSSAYPIPLKRRYEAVVSYDVLAALHRTGG